jgi:uncharacterized protein YdeI (YjbR/CyaY-like superfamily)
MGKDAGSNKKMPVLEFKDQKAWTRWLDKNHSKSSGIWLRLAKKASGHATVSYYEALESALCYGWIDGQKKADNAEWWLQKFTPRGTKSIWSKVNCDKAETLVQSGQMRAAGMAAIESARRDGRWDAAYDSPRNAAPPADFQAELDRHPKAKEFFATLNRANRYAILWRLQTAKKIETRTKRIQQFVEMLEKKEKLHP